MKKILTILTSFSLIATSSFLVVACKPFGIKSKLEKEKDESENNSKKEKKISESKEEMLQGDQSISENGKEKSEKLDKKHPETSNNFSGFILSSIEDERSFIKNYYDRLEKKKTNDVPHLFNPKDPDEIFALGYEKTTNSKDGIKLKQIPKNVKKVPSFLPKMITSLESAFKGNLNKTIEGIESWDTSNVKSLYQTFFDANNFNGDITKWQTHNVEDFNYMLSGANSFDRNLSKWKVNKRPFQVGFAKNSTFDNKKNFWPPFNNK
ncbi:BspA family leucine-rich repeat surface protein [Mycoplasma capricolum]|uniref:BspA family leucine-rich repeat surface protein n=1 Tax=Mycoplasma capricolum TaxID=2095 RepID=UPI003DA462D6